ncbi:MAG: protein-L-isoaspartate O-methyltransferase [Hymenobacter sp.]|nr:protein-L-isoaspartate O-methyltransferase [Hymenobacter sp.]
MKNFNFALLLSLLFFGAGCSEKDSTAISPSTAIVLPQQGISRLETAQDLDPLLAQLGSSRYALLGDATHGTTEFYAWRATLTKRLIQEKGFTLIAVEGDWPAIYELNRYVKGANNAASAAAVLHGFDRWPTWLWANPEIAELAEWLRTYNSTQPAARKVGFYGLDLYSLWESLENIRDHFPEADAATLTAVDTALDSLSPYNRDEQRYMRAASGGASAAGVVGDVLTAVRNRVKALPAGSESAFNAEQNALVAVNAERYYRTAVRSNAGSWNLRDQHMVETINRLMSFHGATAKIAVWEHNTHIGDARYTDMASHGEVNVGQLMREQHATEGVYAVGTGTYSGTVTAAAVWGSTVATMVVPAAKSGSWEAAMHEQQPGNKLILLDAWRADEQLTARRGHRAIGVEYNPNSETGNYVPTDLPHRYDAFLFIDQTQALRPLPGTSGQRQVQALPQAVLQTENF